MVESGLDNIDRKKAAMIGIFAIGSALVSYLVYQRVADDERNDKPSKRERMLRKARLHDK